MTPIYQTTGADRTQNGNCLQACLATLLGRRLDEVPNFLHGTRNGKPIADYVLSRMNAWLKANGCGGYVEFSFNISLDALLKQVSEQSPNIFYLLTGCTRYATVHSVVCHDDHVLHDPATSAGQCTVVKPCEDDYYRVGFLLHKSI